MLYIRRGYDPRSDPASKQYQAVMYTLPSDWYVWQVYGIVMGRIVACAPMIVCTACCLRYARCLWTATQAQQGAFVLSPGTSCSTCFNSLLRTYSQQFYCIH